MHIYEVVALKDNIAFKGIESSVVIARSPENAVHLVVNSCNDMAGFERYKTSDFAASSPIDPNDYAEETIIN